MVSWPRLPRKAEPPQDPDEIELADLREQAATNQKNAASAALKTAAVRVSTGALLREVRHTRYRLDLEQAGIAAEREITALLLGTRPGRAETAANDEPPPMPLPGDQPAQGQTTLHERRMASPNAIADAGTRYPGVTDEEAVARAAGDGHAFNGRPLNPNYAPRGSAAQRFYEDQFRRTTPRPRAQRPQAPAPNAPAPSAGKALRR